MDLKKRKKAAQTKAKWVNKKLLSLSKVQPYTRQQWKILVLWMAFFTVFLASWLPWISHHFKSNPPLEGPDGHSSWSGWIRMCTWALTHLLYMVLTHQAEGAVLSIFLRYHLDDILKIMCIVVCFAYSQHLPLWTLLFPQTTAVLIKGKSSVLKSQVGASINVICAARCKVCCLFTLRCY